MFFIRRVQFHLGLFRPGQADVSSPERRLGEGLFELGQYVLFST